MVTIEQTPDGVEIDGQYFSESELDTIQTRIERNEFGERSHLRFGDGITLLRDGDTIQIGKPDTIPKESWSYKEWVHQSDGWKTFASAPRNEWLDAFETYHNRT